MPDTDTSIVVFDVETTGLDKARDQIIELSIQRGLKEDSPIKTWRIRPTVPISPDAQKTHGITMEDLRDCAKFSSYVDKIRQAFDTADVVVGYNVSFDLQILQAELARVGQPPIDLADKLVIDPLRLWRACEPRHLQDAHKRFADGEFDEAHSSAADVAATGRVLRGMLRAFKLRKRSWEAIADICDPDRALHIGPSDHFQWRDGKAIIAFGKHSGKAISEVAAQDESGYLRWMLKQDFPPHTKEICGKALKLDPKSLRKWIVDNFGPSPTGE